MDPDKTPLGMVTRFFSHQPPLASMFLFISFVGCAVDPQTLKMGVFVDSPVEGLMYQAGRLQGRTDSAGTFYFEEGNTVVFSIEGVIIGEPAEAKSTMTPMDLVSQDGNPVFVTHPAVINIARLLQSLDQDQNPDNGIVLPLETREKVRSTFLSIDFSESAFEAQVGSFFAAEAGSLSLRSVEEARSHLFRSIATQNLLPIDMIHLGDGFTNGTQSTSIETILFTDDSRKVNVHEDTQINGYAQRLADQITPAVFSDFEWNNPILSMDLSRIKFRKSVNNSFSIPNNLGVHGTRAGSLVEEAQMNAILEELIKPLGGNLSQLDAALVVASQEGHDHRMKLFTIWIGIEEVLGALTSDRGGALTIPAIEDFLSSPSLSTITQSLDTMIDTLKNIPHSYIFIGTIPDMTRMAALFYKEDLENLATFEHPDLFELNGDILAIGFHAFEEEISEYLKTDNTQLNLAIRDLDDPLTLSVSEADLIQTRIDELNEYIRGRSSPDSNIYVVDLHEKLGGLFTSNGMLPLPSGGAGPGRGYGRGFFSMDGIYPSHTGHMMIAKEFLSKIADVNDDGIVGDIGLAPDLKDFDQRIESIWASDPYRDRDGDGFLEGPGLTLTNGQTIIDPMLEPWIDCNDDEPNVLPEVFSGAPCP